MSRTERFLNAYAIIEHELQRMLNIKQHRRFYDLVRLGAKINPIINRYKFDLKEYGDLRNAIVHDRHDGRYLAEPTEETTAALEGIAEMLLNPPRVMPLFKKKVASLDVNDPIRKAISEMSRLGYSQLAVMENDTVAAMITSNMIVRWLGQNLAAGCLELERTLVGDVLQSTGCEDNFQVVSEAATLFEVLELFYHYQTKHKKLEAVLITRFGQPDEPLLGIITNRDLALVQYELEASGCRKAKADGA